MVPSSQAVQSIEEIAVQRLSVLKAQIPVDGRKKAEEVTFANTPEEAKQKASRSLGTDLRGYVIKDIQKEYFLAVT